MYDKLTQELGGYIMDNICKFVKSDRPIENINIINFVYEKRCEFRQSFITSASHALYIVTSGSGVLHTLNKNFTLNEGDLFLTFSSKPYYIENRNNLQYIYISFIGLRSSGLFERLDISYKKPVYNGFSFITKHWIEAFNTTTDNNIDLKCESLILYTFSFLCKKLEENIKVKASNNILLLKQYVDNNYTDPLLSLKSVSEKYHYSPKYLSSAFSKLTKIPFTEYLTNLRINHAKALLKSGKTNIQEIALSSGFSDPQYFSRTFKNRCGVSPKNYLTREEV